MTNSGVLSYVRWLCEAPGMGLLGIGVWEVLLC